MSASEAGIAPALGRSKQDHNTPLDVIEAVRAFDVIGLDPCSNPWSLVSAEAYCSDHDGGDGLSLPWAPFGLAFVNPPYGRGRIIKWVRKCAQKVELGAEIILLVPCSPDTKWAREARATCDAYVDWHCRIPFIGAGGAGAKAASRLYYFGPRPYLFAHVMQPYAADVYVRNVPRKPKQVLRRRARGESALGRAA